MPTEAVSESQAVSNWMASIADAFDPNPTPAPAPAAETSKAEAPKPEPPKEENKDGKTGQVADNAADRTQDKPPATDGTGSATVAKVATVEPKPEKAQDKAEKPANPPAEDEKMPRTGDDWAKYKAKRQKVEEKLKTQLSEKEKALAELNAKLAGHKPGQLTPEQLLQQAEYKRLKEENDEYSKRLQVLEVTKHPKFEAYFGKKEGEQIDIAKAVVGSDKASDIERILKMPDGEWKTAKIEEFIAELPVLQQSRIGAVLNNLDSIQRERATAIEEAKTNSEKLRAENESKQTAMAAEREKLWESIVSQAQDAETGIAPYQPREGDDEWNQKVLDRINTAKSLLFGKDIKPEQVVQAALHAVAFPAVLEQWQAYKAQSDAEVAKLQAQVKALSAAQPKGGKPGELPGTSSGNTIRPGMNPQEAIANFAKGLWEA